MNISIYTGYFHDGSIIDIKSESQNINFFLESSYIDPLENIELEKSKQSTLIGILHLENVKSVTINSKESKILKMDYDDGEILRLKILNNKLFLFAEWINFPPKDRLTKFETIEIEAEKIWWENLPNLKTKTGIAP